MPAEADPNLLTPFTQVDRRSVTVKDGEAPIRGRWVSVDNNGEASVADNTDSNNVFLVLSGLKKVKEGADASLDAPETVDEPSAAAANEVGVAYGVYRFEVGPIGFGTIDTPVPGKPLYLDAFGRLTTAVTATVPVAVIEQYVADTKLVARTLAAAAVGSP